MIVGWGVVRVAFEVRLACSRGGVEQLWWCFISWVKERMREKRVGGV